MHVTILFHDLSNDGPVWRNGYWPLIDLMSGLGSAQLLEVPWNKPASGIVPLRSLRKRLDQRRVAETLAAQARPSDDPETLIFAIALNASMVDIAAETVRRLPEGAGRKVLYIDENIEPGDAQMDHWRSFDRIVCFCSELAEQIQAGTGVPTSYWPPHLDLLRFHSTRRDRPIDLFCFGRSRTDILFEMQRRFLDPAKSALCVDFLTRTQADRTQSAEAEFRLLFDAHSKSRASLCFPPHDVPRFKGRSPLLARWIYAWGAGCAVIGTRPKSPGAQPHMDWPGAMVELPDDVAAAGDLIEDVLADADALRRQGIVNAGEALARHDTRYRLRDLFEELGFQSPATLQDDIERLTQTSVYLKETMALK